MKIPRWLKWFRNRPKTSEIADSKAEIGSDVPIRNGTEDRLRRTDFAHRIAAILSETRFSEGSVFAIRGPWGHGKSSLMNLIIEQLQLRPDDVEWLQFNPWQWGDADSIAKALFKQLADKLGGTYSSTAALRSKKLRRYGAILTGMAEPLKAAQVSTQTISTILTATAVIALASSIGFALPSAAAVATVIAVIGIAIPIIGKIMTLLGRDKWAEPLEDIRYSLESSLKSLEKTLIIFVDDIDRLEQDQIRLLIRQIKINANLPNIVFILIFQRSIVESALNPISDNQGREFLEKIVQANFDLPAVPPSVVHRIFTEELSIVANAYANEENGFNQVRWGNVLIGCIQPYVRNLRDARRLIASITIHLPIHAGRGAFEVNIIDLLALETLRVFEPDFHTALFQSRDLVLQTGRFGTDGRDGEQKERAEKLIEVVPEQRREIARSIIRELFPTLGWAFGGSHYGDDWHARWINEKRACSARFFPRYFELQTPEGELSESDFASFLSLSGNRSELTNLVKDIQKRGLLPSLAARLDESIERLPAENAPALLPIMFEIAQFLVKSKVDDSFNSPWVSAWRATSWYIQKIPAPERSEITLSAFRETEAFSVAAIIIHLNDPEDREESERRSFEPALDLETLQSLKNEWLQLIRQKAMDADALLRQLDLGNILYRWRDYSGSIEEPKEWVSRIIETDQGFSAIAEAMMSTGTTHGWGDKVSARVDRFDQETIAEFIGLDNARRRLETVSESGLEKEAVHALGVLRRHLQAWTEGKTTR